MGCPHFVQGLVDSGGTSLAINTLAPHPWHASMRSGFRVSLSEEVTA